MKPPIPPSWPHELALTPRTASVSTIRRLEIVDFEFPLPDDRLVEVVPFGAVVDGGGVEWIAVRATVDLPGTTASIAAGGWVERRVLEALPRLRDLILEAPSDPSPVAAVERWSRMLKPTRRRTPSMKLRLSVQPGDGMALLQEWRRGRRPVLRTLAFLERVRVESSEADEEVVAQAWVFLSERDLSGEARTIIIRALEVVTKAVARWEQWPQHDHDDFDQWTGGVDDDDPGDYFFGDGFDETE